METNLKKCKWCGKEYHKTHNRQEYCGNHCKKQALKETWRKNKAEYRQKWGYGKEAQLLGSGLLSPHPHNNWEEEYQAIQTELKRLKLKPGGI